MAMCLCKEPKKIGEDIVPIPFRFAFQGGGAKFVTLLAASKAVYDHHVDDKSEVSIGRVSGTSAGAIAAGLLAAGIDPAITRNHLKSHGRAYLSSVIRERNLWLTAFRMIVQGYPLYNQNDLQKMIEGLLAAGGKSENTKVKDVGHSLSIVSSDLLAKSARFYENFDTYDNINSRLSTAIANSCSLPFIFKSARGANENHVVDGGVIENLPIERLRSGEHPASQIVAFSFEEDPADADITRLSSYAKSLVDTAINSNIRNSSSFLPDENIIHLPYRFGTMDFADALKVGLDDHFDSVRQIVDKRLSEISKRESRIIRLRREGSHLSRMIDAEESARKLAEVVGKAITTIDKVEISVVMDSLREKEDDRYSDLDTMQTTYNLHLDDSVNGIFSFRTNITSGTKVIDFSLSEIKAIDEKGDLIEFIAMPGAVQDKNVCYWIPIFLFIDASRISGKNRMITVSHTDMMRHAMPFLRDDSVSQINSEVVEVACSYRECKNVEWRAHIPSSLAERITTYNLKEGDSQIENRGVVHGTINDKFETDQRCPMDFRTIQWASNSAVREGQVAGFVIRKNS